MKVFGLAFLIYFMKVSDGSGCCMLYVGFSGIKCSIQLNSIKEISLNSSIDDNSCQKCKFSLKFVTIIAYHAIN